MRHVSRSTVPGSRGGYHETSLQFPRNLHSEVKLQVSLEERFGENGGEVGGDQTGVSAAGVLVSV